MRCPWFRHCQSTFVGVLLVALAFGAWYLWETNQRGFSGKWGQLLQEQLHAKGFHAEFSSTRLSLSQGLVVNDLKVFSDESHAELAVSAKRLVLDIDRAKALRGYLEVRSVQFENGFIKLPSHCAPHHLSGLRGQATLCREGQLSISETSGFLGQLAIKLNSTLANLTFPESTDEPGEGPSPLEGFIDSLHQEIVHWTTSQELPAQLAIDIKGSLAHPSTLEAQFQLTAPQITRLNYEMTELMLKGRLNSSSLFLEKISFQDNAGALEAIGRYDFLSRTAEVQLHSKAHLARLLGEGLNIHKLNQLTFTQPPHIIAQGTFIFPKEQAPEAHITGEVIVNDFTFLGSSWSQLTSDFSWQKGDLYLRDFTLEHPEGQLTGQLLFQDENIRYQARSTLPPRLFHPFVRPGGVIQHVIDKVGFDEKSKIILNLFGSLRPSNLTEWSASGNAEIENFSYNQVPAHYASSSFNLTPLQSIYENPEIEFDLSRDSSYLAFGGEDKAVVRADRIQYDGTEQLTRIEHLHGICWPAPILKLFLPKISAYVEQTYRPTQQPAFSSSGQIDHRPDRSRTSFQTRIESGAPLYYHFLGQQVEFRNTSMLLHTHKNQIDINELSSYAFSGPVNGQISVFLPRQQNQQTRFAGKMLWTRIRLAELGQTYGFDNIEKGLLTGRLEFQGAAHQVQAFNGLGNIGLEQGELFKAPIFGPLSPIMAGIMGHKKASHETARDASANFIIRNGILLTDDFITSTNSLTVKAEGQIDLERKTLQMTARADTEGILKLVTLPLNLTPLGGLFQFQGSGPVSQPNWKIAPFTAPPKHQQSRLFPQPPKAKVVEE